MKRQHILVLLWCAAALFLSPGSTMGTTLRQTVEQALKHSPQLKALEHNYNAIGHDLAQSRANYRPSIDLQLGYGLEQHSDDTSRDADAKPAATDWDPRYDATLRLTQRLYNGGQTRQQVSIQKALLDAAHYRRLAAEQSVALDAITAHLEIYRQAELVAVANKNLRFHQDIHQLLAEREQAGAGNIADVTQTRARLARAKSDLFIARADLIRGQANYKRVVGTDPLDVDRIEMPTSLLPESLEAALALTKRQNPELLAFKAGLSEADARLALSKSNFKPELNFELSSRYNDQMEGNSSWQHTNDAMLVMRWNLYGGGRDKAAEKAALSRKYLSRSNRDDKWLTLNEAMSAAWTSHESLKRQKKAFGEAADYSRETLDAYLKQFSVSKRNLLDVLSAANDFAQSASQLISASVNEAVVAYRILKLAGALQVPESPGADHHSENLSRLAEAMVFPAAFQSEPSDELTLAATTQSEPEALTEPDPVASVDDRGPDDSALQYTVRIGPCITRRTVDLVVSRLSDQGLEARQTTGSGPVRFTRLLEGMYAANTAHQRLADLKKSVASAFVLPQGEQVALYAASFHDPARAARMAQQLAHQQIHVTMVAGEIEKRGTMLTVAPVTRHTAEAVATQMSELTLATKILSQ